MQLSVESVQILLLISTIVAIVARRLRIPYMVGLVLAGVALTVVPHVPEITLTKELLFTVFLPPLVFEAALQIRWDELRRDLLVVLTLSTAGVLLSAAITAAGMHWLVNWSWSAAVLFGVLIAATDPVSVIATFKGAGVLGRLRLLVEAESLFNDSTSAIVFAIALAVAVGGTVTMPGILGSLALSIGGGLICGIAVAGGALLLVGRSDDHLVEITLTTVAAYGAFLVAEHFHASGVLASLAAGLMVGNLGSLGSFTEKGQAAVESFWEYAAFVVNSLIFILMGIDVAHQAFDHVLIVVSIAVLVVLLGRALSIYALCNLFSRSSLRVTLRHQHILFWGGLRGALALALALGLPSEIPERNMIVTVAFGVVAVSVLVQGLTIIPLLRRLGEMPPRTAELPTAHAD